MKSWCANPFVFFIIGLHILSPFTASVTQGEHSDLRTAILSLQALNNACSSEVEHFKSALSGSIMSLRALAGLSYVFMGRDSSPIDDNSSTVIVVVNSPFILSRTPKYFQPLPSNINSPTPGNDFYLSHENPPEVPPPIMYS